MKTEIYLIAWNIGAIEGLAFNQTEETKTLRAELRDRVLCMALPDRVLAMKDISAGLKNGRRGIK